MTGNLLECIHLGDACKETTLVIFEQAHTRVLEDALLSTPCLQKRRRGDGGAPTRMAEATYGVWFPVPKKSAVRGYTTLSPKSLDSPKRHIRSNASRASKILTIFKTRPNLLMSEARHCKRRGKDIGPKVFAFTKTDSVKAKGGEKRTCNEKEWTWEEVWDRMRTACRLFQGGTRARERRATCWRRRANSPGHRH